MNNIYILNKNYSKIGTLSNQGANPQAPYYEDLFVQELETGADTYQFSTMSTPYTQDLLEIGNHIMFTYKNRNELFTITSLEYSHNEGYKTIGVYAEGIGFDLLEIYMKRPENEKESSSGGNDSDGDGDDNTDNEYADPDDVYIDENGNIIYDKYGQDDYADPDNVSIDENGNIIYRRNKHNRKKDSLEFKNISYSRFLSILLKNTGWSYVCQPGLESIKHDITVRYDTNIFALLQDSMQSYRGVELEFVHELVGGRVQKVIKAYKDGGRGSFVGKRFEYGKNVRGITKTQEVTDSEDDTILYVDNVGINVQYDVDFALKSAEVPEIEIGDTHYVIDRDFYPPMTIKARIGKIEISFSDPTVNKIYLANNKRISGSAIEDELDKDDVADMLDDYDFDDGGYDEYVPDHTHDELVCIVDEAGGSYGVKLYDNKFLPYSSNYYDLGSNTCHWRFAYTNNVRNKDDVTSPRFFGYTYQVRYDRKDMKDVKKIGNSGDITKQDLLNFIVNDLNIYKYDATELYEVRNEDVDDPTAYFDKKYLGLLSEDVHSNGKTSRVGNVVSAPVVVDDTNNDGDENANDDGKYHVYNIPALLSCLIGAFQYYVNGGKPTGPSNKDQDDDYENPGGGYNPSDPENPDYPDNPDNPSNPGGGTITDGFDIVSGNLLFVNRIDAKAIEVAQLEVTKLLAKNIFGTSIDIDGIKTGIIEVGFKAKIKEIEFPDGSTLTTANGLSGGTPSNPNTGSYPNIFDPDPPFEDIYVAQIDCAGFNAIEGHIGALSTTQIYGWNNSTSDTIEIYGDVEVIGNITAKNISGGSVSGNTFDTITVTKIQGPDRGEGQYNCVEFADAIKVDHIWSINGSSIQMEDELILNNGLELYGDLDVDGNIYAHNFPSSDISLKENIRYIDAAPTADDLLEKADLYDFIVNQLNICEYNFIGKDDDKIGFIANDYEGTKVGDKIVTRNKKTDLLAYDISNLLFATIGALQEEVRTKDEQIASLEARLARLEAMLDINNDN